MSALIDEYQSAPVSEEDRAMLAYVDKLTRTPAAMTAVDVEALRGAGFSAAAVLDICQVAAYYAFVNRLASGLVVELEPDPQGQSASE